MVNTGNLFSKDKITNGKIGLEGGMFGGYDLESLVSDNPKALAFAKLHEEYNTYAKFTFWLGVTPGYILFIVGLIARDLPLLYGSAFGTLGLCVLGAHFSSESKHYLFEAINTYNGVQAFQPAQPTHSKLSVNLLSFNF